MPTVREATFDLFRKLGMTTIFEAILSAFSPSRSRSQDLDFSSGRLKLELRSTACDLDFASFHPLDIHNSGEGVSDFNLKRLFAAVEHCEPGRALLIEKRVMSSFDRTHYDAALEMLNSANCQMICQISRFNFDIRDFKNARVFACSMDDSSGDPGLSRRWVERLK